MHTMMYSINGLLTTVNKVIPLLKQFSKNRNQGQCYRLGLQLRPRDDLDQTLPNITTATTEAVARRCSVKRFSKKFRKIHRKTPVSVSFLIVEFLRTLFFTEHLRWLLLPLPHLQLIETSWINLLVLKTEKTENLLFVDNNKIVLQ